MCDTCGCNVTSGNQRPGGKLEKTPEGTQAITVLKGLLHENDQAAAHNRAHFDRHGVLAVRGEARVPERNNMAVPRTRTLLTNGWPL